VRIAIVGTELCALDRRGGGLERAVLRWAGALASEHEVVLVSHAPGGRPPKPDRGDPDTVVLERTADLGPALRDLAPDLVHLQNRPQWARHCPSSAAVAVTFHNYPAAWKVRSWPTIRAGAGAVALSAVSRALAEAAADTLGVAPERVAVTPPSIDPAYLDPPPRCAGAVVLSPNRLLRKKGVLDLLEVAGRGPFSDVQFAFADLVSPWVRPTAEHRALRAAVDAVPNAVLFPPPSTAAGLAARYAAAGVVACAVREPEGLGLVALEAQACRAPLVSTDLGGLREATFPPNRCIPADDPDALADALLDGLTSTADRERPRHEVVARFSPAAAGERLLRWVAEAVR